MDNKMDCKGPCGRINISIAHCSPLALEVWQRYKLCRLCYQSQWVSTSRPQCPLAKEDVPLPLLNAKRKNLSALPTVQSAMSRLRRVARFHVRKPVRECEKTNEESGDENESGAEEDVEFVPPPSSPPPPELMEDDNEQELDERWVEEKEEEVVVAEEEEPEEEEVDGRVCVVCHERQKTLCCYLCVAYLRRVATKSAL